MAGKHLTVAEVIELLSHHDQEAPVLLTIGSRTREATSVYTTEDGEPELVGV